MIAYGMKLTLTKGMKKVRKFILRTYRADLNCIAEVHHMNQLMTQHDFPPHIETKSNNLDDPVMDPSDVDDQQLLA
jgi:hypothetical protein